MWESIEGFSIDFCCRFDVVRFDVMRLWGEVGYEREVWVWGGSRVLGRNDIRGLYIRVKMVL